MSEKMAHRLIEQNKHNTNSHKYSYLIIDKRAKAVHWRKERIVFSINGAGTIVCP